MREILFRGKNEETGEWAYGCYDFLVTRKTTFHRIVSHPYLVSVDPDTVGQFTGKTDKNGNKIFEGDIVAFGKSNARFTIHYKNQYMRFAPHGEGCSWMAGFNPDLLVVIGNIHDNPELLS